MRLENVPEALGLIPDGNRRWARSHSKNFLSGYRLGVEKFIDFADWCKDYGIANITVWAFSTENFRRPGLRGGRSSTYTGKWRATGRYSHGYMETRRNST